MAKDLPIRKAAEPEEISGWQFTWHQMHLAILLERPLI